MRHALETLGSTLVLAAMALDAFGQDKSKVEGGSFVEIAGSLVVEPPVNLNAPPDAQPRGVRSGDLVLLQIRYPIVPPMPASVDAASKDGRLEFVSVARSANEIALLERKPRVGGLIGVGFVQVLVRARSAGKDQLTVRLRLADGTVKSLPFEFDVK